SVPNRTRYQAALRPEKPPVLTCPCAYCQLRDLRHRRFPDRCRFVCASVVVGWGGRPHETISPAARFARLGRCRPWPAVCSIRGCDAKAPTPGPGRAECAQSAFAPARWASRRATTQGGTTGG